MSGIAGIERTDARADVEKMLGRIGQRRPYLRHQPLKVLDRQHLIQHRTHQHPLHSVSRHRRRIAGGCPQPMLPSALIVRPRRITAPLLASILTAHRQGPTALTRHQPGQKVLRSQPPRPTRTIATASHLHALPPILLADLTRPRGNRPVRPPHPPTAPATPPPHLRRRCGAAVCILLIRATQPPRIFNGLAFCDHHQHIAGLQDRVAVRY